MRILNYITALVLLSGVALAQSYQMSVADASNRTTNVRALNSATLAGSEYIFTSPFGSTSSSPSNVKSVCFWLDNTKEVGTATSCKHATPFDFNHAGGAGTVVAWDTTKVPDGVHTLTQKVVKLDGTKAENDTATFTIHNNIMHYASMSWTAGTAQYLPVTFSIYRGTVSNGAKNRIAAGLSALSYIDNSVVTGITYYYNVTETDTQGNESGHSNEISATIP